MVRVLDSVCDCVKCLENLQVDGNLSEQGEKSAIGPIACGKCFAMSAKGHPKGGCYV